MPAADPIQRAVPVQRLQRGGLVLPGGGTGGGPRRALRTVRNSEGPRSPVSPLAAVYLAGSTLCGLFFAAAYGAGFRRFRGARPADTPFLRQWREEHPTLLPVRVKICGAVRSPMACGLLRPVILLPEHTDWSDETRLTYALTHEYVHIRRGDLAWKPLLAAALCLHWFNPLVWLLYIRANQDLELACDEAVIRILGLDNRKNYAYALISSAENSFSPLQVTYTTKNHMEERIRAIMKMKPKSAGMILAAAVLVAGITTVFATSPQLPASQGIQQLPSAAMSNPGQGDAPGQAQSGGGPASSIPQETGLLWPLPQEYREISLSFQTRVHPVTGEETVHPGIDIAAPKDTPVFAAKGGVVARSELDSGSAYGNLVEISHSDGSSTLYAHLSQRAVEAGQTVSQGDTIGTVGATGRATGPVLHFGIFIDGSPLDPEGRFQLGAAPVETADHAAAGQPVDLQAIFGDQAWTVDGAMARRHWTSNKATELPDFYDLFPADWTVPNLGPVTISNKSDLLPAGSLKLPTNSVYLRTTQLIPSQAEAGTSPSPFYCFQIDEANRDVGVMVTTYGHDRHALYNAAFVDSEGFLLGWVPGLEVREDVAVVRNLQPGRAYGVIVTMEKQTGSGQLLVDYADILAPYKSYSTSGSPAAQQTTPGNRWDVPENPIPERTTLSTADEQDLHELMMYLRLERGYAGSLGFVTHPDGRKDVIVAEGDWAYGKVEIPENLTPDGNYPVNSRGETYGKILQSSFVGYDPDLVEVVASNGAEGYALKRELEYCGYQGPTVTNEDWDAYQEWLKTQPARIHIPVYDVNRDNVVGYFEMENYRGADFPQERIDEILSDVEEQLRKNPDRTELEIEEAIAGYATNYEWT